MTNGGRFRRVAAKMGLLATLAAASASTSCDGRSVEPEVARRSSALAATMPTLPQFLVYGERSVTLGSNDHANGGDIGVESLANPSFGPQLKIGTQVLVDTTHTLYSPSVTLGAQSSVGGVLTNALTSNGAMHGSVSTFPATGMPSAPLAGAGIPGATNVSVAANTSRTLAPGSYGALSTSGIVFLGPGSYSFTSVSIATSGQLVANGGGVTTVAVAGQFVTSTRATIAALSGGAGDLMILVAGNDSAQSAVTIGAYSSVVALIASPNGTLSIADHADAKGAFAGFDVTFGAAVVLTYQQGFPVPAAHPAQQLSGYLTPAITSAPLLGPLPQGTLLTLAIGLDVQDRSTLVAEVHAAADPTSPSYRQYLTPAVFTSTFSPTVAAYQELQAWATAASLVVAQSYANRLLLDVQGTAAQIEQALSIGLVIRARPDGTQFYSLDREPAVTLDPLNPIFRISGLDDLQIATPGASPALTGSGPSHLFVSADLRAAYSSCTTNTGNGQKVGLFELDGFASSDVTGYGCSSGLLTCDPKGNVLSGALPTISPVLVDGYSGNVASRVNQLEVTSDIEMAVAMAPGLSAVTVFEAANNGSATTHNDILNKMASDTSILQFSSSWFFGTDGNTQTILYALARQGQSFMQCAGDEGSSSWTGDPGDIRALDAVTVVGGTILKMAGTPLAYQSETTWNRSLEGASGGGIANATASPSYQSSFSAPLGVTSNRTLPDLAMIATDEYAFVYGGGTNIFGTSFATPLFAAWIALANQQSASLGIAPAGFVNPFLYDVAGGGAPIYNGSFNDIADGSTNAGTCPSGVVSSSVCQKGGMNAWAPSTTGTNYTAITGYDMATGLGTPRCLLQQELGSSTIQVPSPDAGTDGGAASGDGATSGAPSLALVATEGAKGVEFCMQGSGFDPGHQIQFTYMDLPDFLPDRPEGQAPLIVGAGGTYTNFDPTFGGGDSSEQGFVQGCSSSDLTKNMTVKVVQLDDTSKIATASISNRWICGNEPVQSDTNETALPFPPTFGDTTCPLPPD